MNLASLINIAETLKEIDIRGQVGFRNIKIEFEVIKKMGFKTGSSNILISNTATKENLATIKTKRKEMPRII